MLSFKIDLNIFEKYQNRNTHKEKSKHSQEEPKHSQRPQKGHQKPYNGDNKSKTKNIKLKQ